MTVQLTEAGTESRSIMRWAWQDPPRRAAAALEAVHQMAAAASGDELAEIRDAVSMLTRLVSSLPAPSASGATVSAQMAGPQTIGEQVELAALHGHHIPGTAYTMRHGWIPLIGPQLNDPYPQWFIDAEKRKAHDKAHDTASATAKATAAQDRAKRAIARAAAAAQAAESPELMARRHATVPSAQDRVMTPAMRKLLNQHTAAIAKAQRAAEAAASPATPRTPGGSPTTRTEAAKDTLPYYAVPPGPAPGTVSPGAASELIRPAVSPPGGTPRVAPGAAPDSAQEAAAVFSAAASMIPTPARQAAVDAGQALKTTPGTVAAKLQETDPALASLAAPGASMAALKSYIDARVAAEVARQTGQITAAQHEDVDAKLGMMHRSQQALIAHLRKTAQGIDDESNREDRIHLAMYSLFAVAGVGITVAGLVFAWPAIAIAMVAAAAPLGQIIHDYVRSD